MAWGFPLASSRQQLETGRPARPKKEKKARTVIPKPAGSSNPGSRRCLESRRSRFAVTARGVEEFRRQAAQPREEIRERQKRETVQTIRGWRRQHNTMQRKENNQDTRVASVSSEQLSTERTGRSRNRAWMPGGRIMLYR